MSHADVTIQTPDGAMRAFAFTPHGDGPWPAVLFFMDGVAIRPALFEMAERLASRGYYVLLPDLFWRLGLYEPVNVVEALKDEASRRATFGRLMSSTDPRRSTSDTGACLEFLAAQPQVRTGKVGVTGYCMGGGMALRAAGRFPDRIAAAAAFHGGNLATDAPDSPHLLAPMIKAKVLVAGADADAGFPPEQAERLKTALDAAGVDNEVTIYEGARHGYAPPDMPVYDREASERHWREMLALFDGVLKPA
jgi:carboxymethylenebutenolidase